MLKSKKNTSKTLAIGITGGIGSGKTTVCKIFELLGIPVYYADKRAKELMVTDKDLISNLKNTFGEETYFPDGSLNRQHLSSQVFKDKKKLILLNSFVHPAVFRDTIAWTERHSHAPYTLREAAIAFESGSYKTMDKMITVFAPKEVRMKRVMNRDGSSEEQILARMNNQMPEEEKIKLSDFVIYNDGSQSLIKQVFDIHQQLTTKTRRKRKLRERSLLWQVSGMNLKEKSYLFGSMHVRDKRAFQLFEKLKPVIDYCEAFATEFDLADADPIRTAQYSTIPDGKTLKDILTTKQYKKLENYLKQELGAPIEMVMRQKPFFISNMVAVATLQNDMDHALDEALYRYAQEVGKSMLGLETFDEQLQILEKIDMDLQVKYLMESIKKGNKQHKTIDRLTKYYIQQNIYKLYKKAKKSMEGLEEILINERNHIMVDRFVVIAEKSTLFAVIGAGHLAGDEGVLKLLKKKGYKVEAVYL